MHVRLSLPERNDLTLGVEEEFVLADPATGGVALAAPRVLELLDGEPAVMPEFLRFQIETATGIHTRLDEIRAELLGLRRLVADAAGHAGCLVLASGTPPCGDLPGLPGVTAEPRYRALAARYPALLPDAGTCACHVHVGIPSPALGVRVLAGLRPWLAPLLAISPNSPLAHDADSGWASGRYPLWSRWPTANPPLDWPDATAYAASVDGAVSRGEALDANGVYYYARLSPKYPTVEVRIADVGLTAEDAVLLAGLIRALVVTILAEARAGLAPRPVRTAPVAASLTAAARGGYPGQGIDPGTGQVVPNHVLVARLLEYVRPALQANGDFATIDRQLAAVRSGETGAARQRALFADAGSPAALVAELASATLAGRGGYGPAPRRRPVAVHDG
ncbi:YbdK family carboxylate-amine ligase [Amycolatopsis sp. FBCC-B4732]|uniref:carboxylate-amine ligase n=1 Tax=Amycolatopsis sp. FBCC-B4732 TaxID=3079339 RepID=UPI001FF5979D|nr:YbdK family carboxylate-amine ligase [Amycolatopsis sp. FBCC-B4732]UOX90472.1 YbdK family carboxylate-amine ligase [Amycolatopsis sp. FBCC-B4732]